MADALDTITKLIQSPPIQLAAGGVLAGIVWKFFERVEAVLTENTKLEIAVWLVGVKLGQKMEPWPETFARMFDRVFGTKHVSWTCFARSCVASLIAVALSVVVLLARKDPGLAALRSIGMNVLVISILVNVLPDYFSLLKTRAVLHRMSKTNSFGMTALWLLIDGVIALQVARASAFTATILFLDASGDGSSNIGVYAGAKALLSDFPFAFFHYLFTVIPSWNAPSLVLGQMFFWPPFFTSIWLWLYGGSGFLLKTARRFDIGFDWFNRHFDIEKKPLQSIGLVAGALVAVLYWGAVIVSRV